MIIAAADFMSGYGPLPVSQMAVFSLYPHMGEGARELSGVCFIKSLIPFMRDPLLWPRHSHIPSPSIKYHHVGNYILACQFWEDTNIQSTVLIYNLLCSKMILDSLDYLSITLYWIHSSLTKYQVCYKGLQKLEKLI